MLKQAAQKAIDYVQLIKLRLSLLVLTSTLVGFWLASGNAMNLQLFWRLALGVFLIVAGANAANELIEIRTDALMRRTSTRPLPAGRMRPEEAAVSTFLMSLGGFMILAYSVDRSTLLLGVLAYALYVFAYTPLKKVSPWCVFVGAFPGAIPAMMGPTAVERGITPLAWIFFGLVFLWQFPHFCAIAWVGREDYEKAGLRVLACPGSARFTAYQILLFSCALLAVSPLLTVFRETGSSYLFGALALSLLLLTYALRFWFNPSQAVARRLMGMALLYLPFLFLLMIMDKAPVRW